MPSDGQSSPQRVGYAGLGMRAVLLLAWFWAAIVITVLALGAHQFQLKVLAEEAKAGSAAIAVTLSRVVDVHTRYRGVFDECVAGRPEREKRILERHRAHDTAENELSKANAAMIETEAGKTTALQNLFVETRAKSGPGLALPEKVDDLTIEDLLGRAVAKQISIQAATDALDKLHRAEANVRIAVQRFQQAQFALNRLSKDFAEGSCDAVTEKLFKASGADGSLMRGFILELDAFSKLSPLLFFVGDPMWFVKMPNAILTLLLTLAMGALGSTIFVTVQFLGPLRVSSVTRDPMQGMVPPWPWFIFRPFLGMIVALAVFIAFRAGQISLSATPGGDNGINPFVVSFFALIAGLLSEKAIEYLVRSGEKMFGSEPAVKPPAERVYRAIGLDAALGADTGKTREALATHMGVSPATVDAWIAGREKISRTDAEKIAAWFGKTLSDLFTEEEKPAEGG